MSNPYESGNVRIKKRHLTDAEKLAKYEPDPNTGCWLWLGAVTPNGYGKLSSNRVTISAHRYFYTRLVGPIPEGHFVCHRCDTRICVNPNHLFPGTCLENIQDCMSKGRMPRGERHRNSRLTDERVAIILTSEDENIDLARRFGVTHGLVSKIRKGEGWEHVRRAIAPH